MENPNFLYELAKLLSGCSKLNRNYIKGHNRELFFRERTVRKGLSQVMSPIIFVHQQFFGRKDLDLRLSLVIERDIYMLY